jgi:hypothetical protein
MQRYLRRLGLAVAFALPGLGLVMIAKPMRLGEGTLIFGLVMAFALPLVWLIRGDETPPNP